MNQHRSRPRQRFEREEAQRRRYIDEQNARNRSRGRYISPQSNWTPDSPKDFRKNRSASNPDVTGFWEQEHDSILASRLAIDRDFESDGLSDQELIQFQKGDGRKRSYALAKRNVQSRPRNAYNYHEPLRNKRSRSFGQLDQILYQDDPRIYEPIEQLYNDGQRNDPRNSLGNVSRDSGNGNSRPGSPNLSSSHYDHLYPRMPQHYDPSQRSSHPYSYQPYEQHNPRKTSGPFDKPLLTRQRSHSLDNHPSNTNGQYPRKTSIASQYEERKPRSSADDSNTRNECRNRRDDYIRVPGPGNENWVMRRKSLSMDRADRVRPTDRPNFSSAKRPSPNAFPPRSPRPNRMTPKPPVPTPRRGSREELNDLEDNGRVIPQSPFHGQQDSMDSQKSENIYDNPRDVLNSLPPVLGQPGARPSAPDERPPVPERRPSADYLNGLPSKSIMNHLGNQPSAPDERPPVTKRRPSADYLNGLTSKSIMNQLGNQPSAPDERPPVFERRPSADYLNGLPSTSIMNQLGNQPSAPDERPPVPERRPSADYLNGLTSTSIMNQLGNQPSAPDGRPPVPERRPSADYLNGLPSTSIMNQLGNQPSAPDERPPVPERRPSKDVVDGLPSIMINPASRSSSPDREKTPPERRPSNDQTFRYPRENQYRDEPYDKVSAPRLSFESPEPPVKQSPTLSNGSLPMGFNEGIFPASPSIADTSLSRETFNSNYSNYKLTVENKANQESEVKEEEKFCTNVYVITAKWAAVIIVALLVLFCVTANKICLLVIGHEYSLLSNNSTLIEAQKADGRDRLRYSSKESIVIMLVIIIMLPQAISLVYGVWGKKKSQKWPKKSAILWIIFGGTIEASCLSFLCVYVLTVLSFEPSFFLLFISGLFVIPTIIQISQSAKRWETKKGKMRIVTFTIAAGMQIAGLILLVYSKKEMIELRAKIAIPVTIALLSIAWSPKFRKLQTKPAKPKMSVVDPPQSHHGSLRDLDFQDDDNSVSVTPNINSDALPPIKKQAAREKAAIVMSLVQLIITPAASLLFCKVLGIAEVDKVGEGFTLISTNHPAFYFFLTQIFVTFLGYHMAWLACSMYAQRPSFALPLTLATPIAMILIEVQGSCGSSGFIPLKCGRHEGQELYYLIAVAVLMLTGQFLSTGYYVWANMGYIMGKASHLFWLPTYTGVLLEPFLLLNRRNKVTDDKHVTSKRLARDTYVFVCTTMYHEVLQEMEQLLSSIHDIDVHFREAGRHVESHIFFDGCIKAEVMNSYILQLASVIESTLKVKLADVTKVLTPYGMQLRWNLPGGLPIVIHLKDNTKVKNKKRWSQVMYMSYVLDYKQRILNVPDDQTFILTTDADVKFTHESMEALLDYMVQDEQIGAVCGRTHPLGNGPLVWYQIFDYAIGHWFMKVANHVFGSVLCCPGCFSLYRCQAVRDILPTYSTTVSEAFEFLTKDMGEDRWMCTLMVQQGWRLAYCAAAEDETYCPQEFEEFYKQRRRWMPSTLANLALLVSEWRTVLKNNENISFPFILYQVVLLLATLIGPSIVILFIVGGMVNMGMNEVAAAVLLSSITIIYAAICFFFPQSTQMTVAKFLTFLFAVIMIIVTIGLALQIHKEIGEREDLRKENIRLNGTLDISIEKRLPAGISTLYLAGLSGIFILAAFMHPKEALCLMNGIWYLLCLPSGYLLLTVYSVVNMTDRSWGTREGKSKGSKEANPLGVLWGHFKTKCVCCFRSCAADQQKPPEPDLKRRKSDDNVKDRIKRKLSRKSKKSTKSFNSLTSKKSLRSRLSSKDLDSEVDSESASESVRSKNRINKGSLGKLRLALRHSLKGIGFFKHDDPELHIHRMEDRHPLQHGDMPGKPTIMVTTVPENGPIDYEDDTFQFSEVLGSLHKQQQQRQGSSDEGYSSPAQSFPPLPLNPLLGHRDGQENKGYDMGMEGFPRAPGYPVVIPNGERPSRNRTSPVYDEIQTPGTRVPYSEANRYPPGGQPLYSDAPSYLVHPNITRVKNSDRSSNDLDSDYGSSSTSSQQHRVRRGSSADLIERARDPNQLGIEDNYDTVSTSMGSMGAYSTFALLSSDDIHLPVEDWLKGDLRIYIKNFKEHGYDSIAFICTMKEKDLESIGIKKRGHRQKIAREIKQLPIHEIEEDIPNDVGEWLDDLGLAEYIDAFDDNGYNEPTDLEDLKSMDKDTVKETFKVTKIGHLNMLWQAINKLQYANQGQKEIRNARRELRRVPTHLLEYYNNDGGDEYEFWENLRQARLIPELAGFDGNTELKDKLQEMRNSAVMIFFVANALWMIVIMFLVRQSELKTLGVDLIGLSFLLVYGTIIILQFLAMISHRLTTLLHVLARAPWICCHRKRKQEPEIQGRQTRVISVPNMTAPENDFGFSVEQYRRRGQTIN